MAVIRGKSASKSKVSLAKKKTGKSGPSSGVPAGAGQRLAMVAVAGIVFNIGAFALLQRELKTMASDKAIDLPKVEPLGVTDSSTVLVRLCAGLFSDKQAEITLADLNASFVDTAPKATAEPGPATAEPAPAPKNPRTWVYFLAQGERLISVMSVPLDVFQLEGQYFNPTILMESKAIEGEPVPLLKVSKVQINKQDLTGVRLQRFHNLVNFCYGLTGYFVGIASRSNPQIPAPTDKIRGNVLDSIRVRTHADGTLEFNPDTHAVQP